jgi:hypothetical protein
VTLIVTCLTMPRLPKVFTNVASSATGADVELTPLTAVDPPENQVWRQRFQKQVNSHLSSNSRPPPLGEAASYYDPRSRFSPDSEVTLPRKVRVTQKRFSKWRIVFMAFFIVSVCANVAFITLFVVWYIRFKHFRDAVNGIFQTINSAFPSPTPSS